MYSDPITDVSEAAASQMDLIRESLPAYLAHSALAGCYLGFGVAIAFQLAGDVMGTSLAPLQSLLMGGSFGIALSLVIMAGCELYTGNAMIAAVGQLTGKTGTGSMLKIWVWSWVGNLIGSVVFAALLAFSGSMPTEPFAAIAAAKMTMPAHELFLRGMLCNWLIVLAVWCNFKLDNSVAKLVMIFWCLLVFIGAGFEHSIANMVILSTAIMMPGVGTAVQGISLSGFAYNISIVTAGNTASGVLALAVIYYWVSRRYGVEYSWGDDAMDMAPADDD
jgi:nitrite transporter NirC